MSNTSDTTLVEIRSAIGFEPTVDRILRAIEGAGLKLIARLDHSGGAQAFGLDLPPTLVLVYGHPTGGTPIMQKFPAAALELPLRVLVHELSPDTTIVTFRPIVEVLAALGVPAEMARPLERSQHLIRDAVLA